MSFYSFMRCTKSGTESVSQTEIEGQESLWSTILILIFILTLFLFTLSPVVCVPSQMNASTGDIWPHIWISSLSRQDLSGVHMAEHDLRHGNLISKIKTFISIPPSGRPFLVCTIISFSTHLCFKTNIFRVFSSSALD